MLNISIVFLNFIYVFLNKKRDVMFYALLTLNTVTIIYRYAYTLDYTKTNFWRVSELTTATIMATIFTLPMVWALMLIWNTNRKTNDLKKKKQIRFLIYGLVSSTIISIFSEYAAPIFFPGLSFHSFMYLAFLDLIIFLYLSIVKEKFLNIEMEYIYDELFMNSNEGILLIDSSDNIISMNNVFKSMFGVDYADYNIPVKNIIKDYKTETNETVYEIKVDNLSSEKYFSLIQNNININSKSSMKLLHILDITAKKLDELSRLSDLKETSMKDGLTNLYNKRFLTENYIDNNKFNNNSMSIMFIDIDDFKSINDTFGHLIGDEILKEVVNCINISLRKNEVFIRYGGDEFIVVLDDTNEFETSVIAKRILESINTSKIIYNLIKKQLTISIGISGGKLPTSKLIDQADDAMYRAKALGKNGYSIYSEIIM